MYNEGKNSEDYIFEEIKPKNPDIDLEKLEKIQTKLEDFTSGSSNIGLTEKETEDFLEWVTYNARTYAVRNTMEPIETASMAGECATTQRINKILLSKLGLEVKTFNTSDCIGDIPMNEQDMKRVQMGWPSRAVRHAISLVNIPVINEEGNTVMCKFLLDPTFRQFCLKENCNEEKYDENSWTVYEGIAPHPPFFMKKEVLIKLGETEEYANKSERLCKKLICDGYFNLNEENAKVYGDAFVRASERLEFQGTPINLSGLDYIYNFENSPIDILENNKNSLYTRLPRDIVREETGVFKKIINFLKDKFSKKPKLLGSGVENENVEVYKEKANLGIKLTEEELEQYRIGEKRILQEYSKNDVNSNYNKNKDIGEYDSK